MDFGTISIIGAGCSSAVLFYTQSTNNQVGTMFYNPCVQAFLVLSVVISIISAFMYGGWLLGLGCIFLSVFLAGFIIAILGVATQFLIIFSFILTIINIIGIFKYF